MTVCILVFHRLPNLFFSTSSDGALVQIPIISGKQENHNAIYATQDRLPTCMVLEEMQMLISICVLHDLPQGISKEKSYNLTFCYKFLNKTLKNQLSFSLRMFASFIFKHKMKVGKILPSKYNKQC